MTLLQAFGMISLGQMAYAVCLAALFSWRGPSFILWVMLADFVALLVIAGAMDLGLLVRNGDADTATPAMMIVWVVSAAVLAFRPDTLAHVLAGLSALAIPVFGLTIVFGVQISTTAAIVNAIAFIQLVAVGVGLGNHGGGAGRGLRDISAHMAASFQGDYVGEIAGQGGVALDRHLLSADSRGLIGGRE